MKKKGYNHNSPLDKRFATGKETQNIFINTIKEQKNILSDKPCKCFTEKHLK